MHHIVTEMSQSDQCVYCGNGIKGKRWYSEHSLEHHYKSVDCECGKRIRIKMDFIGSGHDTWEKNIEDKLKK